MDAYISSVLSVKQTDEYIATIDFADGKCWSAATRKDKEIAQKDLDEAIKKYDVNLVPDLRGNDDALSKEERAWVHKCVLENIEYKNILIQSRYERRRLIMEEMI